MGRDTVWRWWSFFAAAKKKVISLARFMLNLLKSIKEKRAKSV